MTIRLSTAILVFFIFISLVFSTITSINSHIKQKEMVLNHTKKLSEHRVHSLEIRVSTFFQQRARVSDAIDGFISKYENLEDQKERKNVIELLISLLTVFDQSTALGIILERPELASKKEGKAIDITNLVVMALEKIESSYSESEKSNKGFISAFNHFYQDKSSTNVLFEEYDEYANIVPFSDSKNHEASCKWRQWIGPHLLENPRKGKWYMELKKTMGSVLTENKKKDLFIVSYPLIDLKGNFVGISREVFSKNAIDDVFKTFSESDKKLGLFSSAFILDKDGNIVFHFSNEERAGEKVSKEDIESTWNEYTRNRNPRSLPFLNDSSRTAYFKLINDFTKTNWVLVTIVSDRVMIDAFSGLLWKEIMFRILLTLSGAGIWWFIFSRVMSPLQMIGKQLDAATNLEVVNVPWQKSRILEVVSVLDSVRNFISQFVVMSQFIPSMLVKKIVSQTGQASVFGEKIRMTALFSDMNGFTKFSSRMLPETLLHYVSEIFEIFTTVTHETNGIIDKYIGDAVMALWGAPTPLPNHAEQSCRAALKAGRLLKSKNKEFEKDDMPEASMGTGIATGFMVVGNMGSSDRLQYTAVGIVVNFASQLETLSKFYNVPILVSSDTREDTKSLFVFRPVDKVIIRGTDTIVTIFELLEAYSDCAEEDMPHIVDIALKTERAWEAYEARDWKKALALYEEVLVVKPKDPIAIMFIERCKHFITTPPPDSWSGVFSTFYKYQAFPESPKKRKSE